MSKNEQNKHKEEIQDHILPEHSHRRRLKQIHHSWIFWIFLFLMFVAIMNYIMTVDLAFAPR